MKTKEVGDAWQAALEDWDDDVPGTCARKQRQDWPQGQACFQGPAWRWLLAMEWLKEQRSVKRSENELIWKAWQYLADPGIVSRCPSAAAIQVACQINQDPLRSLEIEARLLAGYTLKQIAAKVHQSPVVVLWYHDLFFDVLPRMTATMWISTYLFDPAGDTPDALRKSVYRSSYRGGRFVCEHWLSRLSELRTEPDLSTRHGRETKQLQLLLQIDQIQQRIYQGLDPKPLLDWQHRPACQLAREYESLAQQHACFLSRLLKKHFVADQAVAGQVPLAPESPTVASPRNSHSC